MCWLRALFPGCASCDAARKDARKDRSACCASAAARWADILNPNNKKAAEGCPVPFRSFFFTVHAGRAAGASTSGIAAGMVFAGNAGRTAGASTRGIAAGMGLVAASCKQAMGARGRSSQISVDICFRLKQLMSAVSPPH